jgi:hypothetical protein
MTTINTVKRFAASSAIAGVLGLAVGGAALTVGAPANAAPSASDKTSWSAIREDPSEAIRVGNAARASSVRHDWEGSTANAARRHR